VEELPLPVAIALFFFHPVLALLLNAAVSGAHVPPKAAASCALTVLGVLVIGWHDQLMLHLEQGAVFLELLGREGWQQAAAAAAGAGQEVILGPELSLYGVCMGLIAAAANAAAFVVVGLIGMEVSPLRVCWWQYCVTTHAAIAVLLLSQLETAVLQASAATAAAAAAGTADAGTANAAAAALPGVMQAASSSGGFVGGGGEGAAAAAVGALQQVVQQLQQDLLPSQHDALLLSGVVVANFAGQLLLNAGLQRVDAGRGAAINTLQVLFANAWDVLLLHSQPCAAIMAGSGLIAAGVVGTRQSAAEGDGQREGAAANGGAHHTQQQQQQ
jgi:drug/metabolite transporter (DMT)-like permease